MSDLRVTNLRGRTSGKSPKMPDGAVVTGVATATTFSGALSGNATSATTATTATNAQGLTGSPNIVVATTATNAQGLTGTPNIVVGVITATQYVGVPEGTNVLKAMLFT